MTNSHYTELWRRGILGGIVGAVVMAMWAMMVSAFSGMGFWAPVQLIAAVWLGASAMHLSFGVIILGLMTHMMMGMVLGVVLAVLFRILGIPGGMGRLVWGMVYGLVIWVINQFAVLPLIDPLMASHMPPWAFAIAHMMFGIVAAAFLLHSTSVVAGRSRHQIAQ
ncbi:hypothetical protein [Sulfobacillus thermosulfidooxidans]|uniref:hypothetical protein n=1 Tax=Sulfobacillus thermosulfidooxidans TaxID=28034 RepID=UPI0006B4FABA|nr:hypothetical protein [Sulfobacillus thermosulfidooxidans]